VNAYNARWERRGYLARYDGAPESFAPDGLAAARAWRRGWGRAQRELDAATAGLAIGGAA
jgi:hypothetical protein